MEVLCISDFDSIKLRERKREINVILIAKHVPSLYSYIYSYSQTKYQRLLIDRDHI